MDKPILNIDELEYMEWGHGDHYAARFGLMSRKLGARGLGFNLTVVPPGKKAFPMHSHRVNDEMFYIVSGRGTLRVGANSWDVREGDVIACPPGGPETAHQLINSSDDELKYLAVSTTQSPEVAEYPDSDKVGVIIETGIADNGMPEMWRLMMKKGETTEVNYWEGED